MTHSLASFAVPALNVTSSDPQIAVGTVVKGTDNKEFVYVRAAEALAQYAAVAIDTVTREASELTATNGITGVDIGVVQVAFANDEYGFVQTRGALSVKGAASCATDVQLYATAAAGVLDDAGTVSLRGIQLTETLTGADTATAHAQAGISVAAYA